jgi:hypothetical protein
LGAAYRRLARPFSELFQSGKHCVVETAQQYLWGLIRAGKRNMERMAEAVPDSDEQVLQSFLAYSTWNIVVS